MTTLLEKFFPILKPEINSCSHDFVVFPAIDYVINRWQLSDEQFVVVVFIEAAAVVIVGEEISLLIKKFEAKITIPDFAENGAGDFAPAKAEDLIGSFFLEKFGIQTRVDDPTQIHSNVHICLLDGKGIRKIAQEMTLGVIVDCLLNIYLFLHSQ